MWHITVVHESMKTQLVKDLQINAHVFIEQEVLKAWLN